MFSILRFMTKDKMMVKFIDPTSQLNRIKNSLAKRFEQIHRHCIFVMGPEVKDLEERLSDYLGVKHAIACGSGTDALILALMALGVETGDEVICPDFSFFATSESVSFLGARPVFVDIDPKTYNLNPRQLEGQISSKTAAVIPVSLYGQCADYDEINRTISHAYGKGEEGVVIIEDAAQSFGALYKGKKSCSLTTMAATSFYPTKPLAAFGDGGAVFTDCDRLAQKLRELRNHGSERRYHHTAVGMNSRMDSYQAAVLLEKLALLDEEMEQRQEVARYYDEALKDDWEVPFIDAHNLSAYAQYTVRAHRREPFIQWMERRGIPVMIHYPTPLSLQPAYGGKYGAPCPESLKASQEVISLPFHPYLCREDQDLVIAQMRGFLNST